MNTVSSTDFLAQTQKNNNIETPKGSDFGRNFNEIENDLGEKKKVIDLLGYKGIPPILMSKKIGCISGIEKNDPKALLKRAQLANDQPMIEFLLRNKENDEHSLIRAINEESLSIIASLLFDYGVDIEAHLERQKTPLMLAIKKGNLPIVELLLRGGAAISGVECKELNDIPLVKAVECKHKDIVCVLLEKGAFHQLIYHKDVICFVPNQLLRIAIMNEDLAMIQLLKEQGVLDIDFLCSGVKDEKGDVIRTPLMRAANVGNSDVFDYLLECGANPHIVDYTGNTTLTYALRSQVKNEYIVMTLLEKGVEVNIIPIDEGNMGHPIAKAVERNWNVRVVRALLDCGARVDACGNYSLPISKDDIVKKRDMRFWACDNFGRTNPLRMAVYNGNKAVFEELLAHGATISVPITDKSHPIAIAVTRGWLEIVELLLDSEELDIDLLEIGDCLMKTAKTYGRLDIVAELYRRGFRGSFDAYVQK